MVKKIFYYEKSFSLSFKKGLETQLELDYLQIFFTDEINHILSGDNSKYFTINHLKKYVIPDYGYDNNSNIYKWFIEIIQELKEDEKKDFILFLTGNQNLPYGGFEYFKPKFKIVRKNSEDFGHLPSVMTCHNSLKIPNYKNKNVLKKKLLLAIKEGNFSFLLS